MFKKSILGLALTLMTSAAFAGDIVLDMTLAGGQDNTTLVSGNAYNAVIGLAAPTGTTIPSVRLMQMDDRNTSGSTLTNFTWNIGGGSIDPSLYHQQVYSEPNMVRANYTGLDPVPGFILDLTDTPTEIGNYDFTFNTPGALNIVGLPNDDGHRDVGLYFQTGFDADVETYNILKGNILPSGQSDTAGNLPLTPEPASLGLLGLGALALLRRRSR